MIQLLFRIDCISSFFVLAFVESSFFWITINDHAVCSVILKTQKAIATVLCNFCRVVIYNHGMCLNTTTGIIRRTSIVISTFTNLIIMYQGLAHLNHLTHIGCTCFHVSASVNQFVVEQTLLVALLWINVLFVSLRLPGP